MEPELLRGSNKKHLFFFRRFCFDSLPFDSVLDEDVDGDAKSLFELEYIFLRSLTQRVKKT